MKKINAVSLGFTFCGCFLGAGFVSGQELWQFFGSFGLKGLFGVVLASVLLGILGIIVMRLAGILDTADMDKLVIRRENKILRAVFAFFEIFFLFGVNVIMTAGAGALINQQTGLNTLIASILFAAVATVIAMLGARGLITAFSVTVPLLLIMSAAIFCVCMAKGEAKDMSFAVSSVKNPLISNWFVSATVFVSYNFFAAIGILSPLGQKIKKRSTVNKGIALGTLILALIAICLLLTITAMPQTAQKKLPMLEASALLGKALQAIFAALLICGMLGAAFSGLFAINEYTLQKTKGNKKAAIAVIAATSVLSVAGSVFGFSELIGVIYPIFGYLGFIAIFVLIINFFAERKKLRKGL